MEFVENSLKTPYQLSAHPVSGVREIERLMDDLEPDSANRDSLTRVQSSGDPVVTRGIGEDLRMLGARDKKYVVFNISRHGILIGEDSEKVYKSSAIFCAS